MFFRTEILGCLSDMDFLAKLHCVRQACQVGLLHLQFNTVILTICDVASFRPQLILRDRATRMFLADTGKKILSSIIVKAHKVSSIKQ